MDLVGGVKKVVVLMEHSAKGESKLLKQCTLPLTGAGVVDMVITDLGVFTVDRHGGGMTLIELAPDVTLDEIKSKTEALAQVSMKLGESMYKAQQEAGDGPHQGPGGGAGGGQHPGHDDNVVDADFEEVDDQKKRGSA